MQGLKSIQITDIKRLISDDFETCEYVSGISPVFAVIGWLDFANAGISSVLEHQGLYDLLYSICKVYNLDLQWIYDNPEPNDFQGVNFMLEYKS